LRQRLITLLNSCNAYANDNQPGGLIFRTRYPVVLIEFLSAAVSGEINVRKLRYNQSNNYIGR